LHSYVFFFHASITPVFAREIIRETINSAINRCNITVAPLFNFSRYLDYSYRLSRNFHPIENKDQIIKSKILNILNVPGRHLATLISAS
jgi:hypothetical protein